MTYQIKVVISEEEAPRSFYDSLATQLKAQHGTEGIQAIIQTLEREGMEEKEAI